MADTSTPDLIDAQDTICEAIDLVTALRMAAASISNHSERNALTRLIAVASERLKAAEAMIETIRTGEAS